MSITMTDHPYITDEAVKAADKARRDYPVKGTETALVLMRAALAAALPLIEPAIRADERAKTLRMAQDWMNALAVDPETSAVGQEWCDVIAGGLSIMRRHGRLPS